MKNEKYGLLEYLTILCSNYEIEDINDSSNELKYDTIEDIRKLEKEGYVPYSIEPYECQGGGLTIYVEKV